MPMISDTVGISSLHGGEDANYSTMFLPLPILMMYGVSSNEEAMALANRSPLGLTAGFYYLPQYMREQSQTVVE